MNLPGSEIGEAERDDLPVYRFANVVVDVARQQLWVEAVEVACQPLAFRLLVMLCEARGALVSRQALFDRLWPGGQEIGDTALTQLIWRLRGALGPAAEAIKTVRRGGVRLDADVRADPLRAPPAEPVEPRVDSPAASGQGPPRSRARWRIGAVFAVLALVGALVFALRDPLVGAEYAIRVGDLDAGRTDTADLLRRAFEAERAADKGRARELFEQITRRDERSPVAPALLAIYSFGAPADVARWAATAKARLRESTPAYTRLLVELAQVIDTSAPAARQVEDAMLDLRPNAWRLHLAIAHQHMSQREFGRALAAYRRVPLDALGPAVMVYVLSDRASLGDADAVAAELDAGRLAHSPALEACVRARLAYTRGRWAQAVAESDRAVALADADRAYDNAMKIAEVGALAAFAGGDAGATARFSRVLARCGEGRSLCVVRMRGFLAVLAARAGERDIAARRLAEAWDVAQLEWERAALHLVALEYGLAPPGTTHDVAAGLGTDPSYAGVGELLRAWQAFADGDRDTARHGLARARLEGVAATYFAEHAQLLGARIGEPPARCTVDPPFPNSVRIAACVELAAMAEVSK